MANIFSSLLTGIFGSRNQRLIKRYSRIVNVINGLEANLQALDDAGLAAKTADLKARYQENQSLDALLPAIPVSAAGAGPRRTVWPSKLSVFSAQRER